jgi:hypothetical protein
MPAGSEKNQGTRIAAEGMIMNKLVASILLPLLLSIVTGCDPVSKSKGRDAAAPDSAVDLAKSVDLASTIDTLLPHDVFSGAVGDAAGLPADTVPSDAGADASPEMPGSLQDAFVATDRGLVTGDHSEDVATASGIQDAVIATDHTFVNPAVGDYSVRYDGLVTNVYSSPVYPLNLYGFSVELDESTGLYWIVYTSDGAHYDNIPVVNGEFYFACGQGMGGIDCQANGYAIKGAFVSSTEATGGYENVYGFQAQKWENFIATHVTDTGLDSGIADTAPFIPNAHLDSALVDQQIIVPIPGSYVVRPDSNSPITDAGDPITPLDSIGLTVRVDPVTGAVTLFFFSAMDTNGIIPVTNGAFEFTHGRGGTDGTVCPANGYSINGMFVSPTEITGQFASICFCQLQNSGGFIATLVQ